jgi:hypothetical protein
MMYKSSVIVKTVKSVSLWCVGHVARVCVCVCREVPIIVWKVAIWQTSDI